MQNGFSITIIWCTERRLRILSPSQLCAPNAGAAQLIGNIAYLSVPRRTMRRTSTRPMTRPRAGLVALDDLIAAGLILDSSVVTTVRAWRPTYLDTQGTLTDSQSIFGRVYWGTTCVLNWAVLIVSTIVRVVLIIYSCTSNYDHTIVREWSYHSQ